VPAAQLYGIRVKDLPEAALGACLSAPGWLARSRAVMKFENVTAVAKANVYFEGKVVSHTIVCADGSKKTLGLIYPGEYHFGTDAAERMEITAGHCRVRLDGQGAWREYAAGSSFRVPAKSGFDIAVTSDITEYVCSFE
jgi:uncharacterized protein YaiE (UPF0345 family)